MIPSISYLASIVNKDCSQQIRAERAEKVKEIESAVRIAHTASKALQGIALRKMRAEAEKVTTSNSRKVCLCWMAGH